MICEKLQRKLTLVLVVLTLHGHLITPLFSCVYPSRASEYTPILVVFTLHEHLITPLFLLCLPFTSIWLHSCFSCGKHNKNRGVIRCP
jgi:hypothetical protein